MKSYPLKKQDYDIDIQAYEVATSPYNSISARGTPSAALGQSACPSNGNCKVCSRLCMQWK